MDELEVMAHTAVRKALEKGWVMYISRDYDWDKRIVIESPFGIKEIEVMKDNVWFKNWLRNDYVEGDFSELLELLMQKLETEKKLETQGRTIKKVNKMTEWLTKEWL